MLHSYFPIYQIALDLETLRGIAKTLRGFSANYTYSSSLTHSEVSEPHARDFVALLKATHQRCLEYGLIDTSDMAQRLLDQAVPKT
jgi:hypothetical protein